MATMNYVKTILRPGVQSIEIFGEGSMGNWVPVEKVVEGRAVKFVVTTYPNFTLTSCEAYYSDEYDDTVQLTLTSVTGQSAWTFTMPNAEVFIRCEAECRSESTVVFPPNGTTTGSIVDFATAKECIDYMIQTYRWSELPDIFEHIREVLPNYESAVDKMFDRQHFIGTQINSRYYHTSLPNKTLYYINIRVMDASTVLPTSINSSISNPNMFYFSMIYNITDGTWFQEPTVIRITNNTYYISSYESQGNGEQTNPLLTEHTPGQTAAYSIRYIMSPDGSGEVDTSAPSEITPDTTSFTFNWRIKASYDFKNIVSFAVGDGSTEIEITSAVSSYDGSIRTYTFTVSQIPDWAKGIRVVINTIMLDDPNNAGGTNASDTSIGGDGTFDDSSDEVPLPAIPTGISAADSGLVTLFRPSMSQVKDFGNYLWSNITDFIENLQKIFTSPMDYVIGFNIFPVTPTVGADRNIYIGNWLTNIQMPPVLNQFYEFNAGTIQVKEYFGSFLDYDPNTRARIMLPFIGDREVNINEIMGKTLHLWYRIDLLSGACVAILNINNNVYYQWAGNCAVAIPVTGSDWSRLYSGIARAGLVVGSTAAFGPAGAITTSVTTQSLSGIEQATAVSAVSDSFASLPKGVPGVSAMRRSLTESLENINEPRKTTVETHSSKALKASTMVRAVGYNVMCGSNRAQHTGDMSGAITIMGNRTPYLVLEYPDLNLPENYKHVFGYPSNQYAVLGNLYGYTKCKEVLFESTTATDDEIEMIISALKGGVYL